MTSYSGFNSEAQNETRRQWIMAVVLAGTFVFFPLGRGYYLFYVIMMIWTLKDLGIRQLWREDEGVRFGFYTVGLPILLTTLAWAFAGGVKAIWLVKFFTVALSTLLGMAAAGFARNTAMTRLAYFIISVAILTWLGEGVLQLLLGNDIDCRLAVSTCNAPHRISLYFAKKTKIGYYIGIMALVPACWFILRRRLLAAIATMAVAGVVVMAAGSRSGMVPWAVGCIVLAFVSSAPLGRLRWVITLGVPVVTVVLAGILFQTNEGFHARVATTAGIFTSADYDTLNRALSGRLDIWVPAWHMIGDHWLFGVGPGDLDTPIRPYLQPGNAFIPLKVFHAHQVLLDVLAATGIVGLAAYVVFYGWATWRFVRLSAHGISMQWAWLLVFLLLWFPINSQHGYYSSEMLFLTFFLLGLGLASPRTSAQVVPVAGST